MLLICQSGYRSLRAAQFLKQMGFEQIASVTGGTAAWIEAGKPLDRGDVDEQATRVIETEGPRGRQQARSETRSSRWPLSLIKRSRT